MLVLLAALLLPLQTDRDDGTAFWDALARGGIEAVRAELPGLVAARMVDANLPGVAVVLVADGRVVYAEGFGRANLAYPAPVTADSVFRVASLTKQFTSMAALMLQEEGRLSLEDPVVKYVPEFRTRSGDYTAITLRHLLTHHSGLPRGPYYAGEHPDTLGQVEDLARMDLVSKSAPGYKYSNAGYALAGLVVERAAGVPYRQFMETRILGPLGMERSGFELRTEMTSDYATGYQTDHYRSWVAAGDPLRAAPLYPAPDAAGNLFASANDVARFLLCLLNRGRHGDDRLISEQSFQQMSQPFRWANGMRSTYGLGLSLGKRYGQRACFRHTGGYYGHSSLIIGLPEHGIGGIVLINRASAHAENYAILDHALNRLLGETPRTLYASSLSDVDDSLAGRYSSADVSVEIAHTLSSLYLVDDGIPWRLAPRGQQRFAISGGRFHGWPIDLERDRLYAGPWELHRGEAPPPRTPSEWDRFCGVYRDDDFGEVHVFRRGEELIWAFSRMEQVELRPLGGTRFWIVGGSFNAEPVEFLLDENGTVTGMEAGYMHFERGSFADGPR